MSNFQAPEVVDRGSETQPQVVENLYTLTGEKVNTLHIRLVIPGPTYLLLN